MNIYIGTTLLVHNSLLNTFTYLGFVYEKQHARDREFIPSVEIMVFPFLFCVCI